MDAFFYCFYEDPFHSLENEGEVLHKNDAHKSTSSRRRPKTQSPRGGPRWPARGLSISQQEAGMYVKFQCSRHAAQTRNCSGFVLMFYCSASQCIASIVLRDVFLFAMFAVILC